MLVQRLKNKDVDFDDFLKKKYSLLVSLQKKKEKKRNEPLIELSKYVILM